MVAPGMCIMFIIHAWRRSNNGAMPTGRRICYKSLAAGRKTMRTSDENEDPTIYKVVVNHEERYSIWPAHRENALGWNDAGRTGTKEECLEYIKEVWTDMRPRSLSEAMEQSSGVPKRDPGA